MPYSGAPWAALLGLLLVLSTLAAATLVVGVPRLRAWWNDDTPRPGEDERGISTEELSLLGHLLELRTRLIRAVIGLAVALAVAGPFFQTWFDLAVLPTRGRGNCGPGGARPAPDALCLQAIGVTEQVFAYFRVTLVVALLVAMPLIVYHVWKYVAPGLTRRERKYVVAVVPGATLSFAVGVAFAYFALLPPALRFLLEFGSVRIEPSVDSYISFFWRLTVSIGLVFQLPLAKLGIVNPKLLGSIRCYVIVGAFIMGAVVTPTPDPFNQALVAIPVLVLYEIGILLTRFVVAPRVGDPASRGPRSPSRNPQLRLSPRSAGGATVD